VLLNQLDGGLPDFAWVAWVADGGIGFVEHGGFQSVEIFGGEEVGDHGDGWC
jgi:hypothetical protein